MKSYEVSKTEDFGQIIFQVNIDITNSLTLTHKIESYHISHESQAIDVSRFEYSSIDADILLTLQASPSKQTTAYKMTEYRT